MQLLNLYGIQYSRRLEERVPTSAFTLQVGAGRETRPLSPRQEAEQLDEANIFVWDGNDYAVEVTKPFCLKDSGGMLRVGPVNYNQAPGFWVPSPRTLGNRGSDPELWGGVGEECA